MPPRQKTPLLLEGTREKIVAVPVHAPPPLLPPVKPVPDVAPRVVPPPDTISFNAGRAAERPIFARLVVEP